VSSQRPAKSWLIAIAAFYSVILFAGGHTALPLLIVLPFLIPAGVGGEWMLLIPSVSGLLGIVLFTSSFLLRSAWGSPALLRSAIVLLVASAVAAVAVSDAPWLSAITAVPFAVTVVVLLRSGSIIHGRSTA
jgi:hypothetical protein